MPLVAAYYRPESVDEALALLAEPNRIPLAGGTVINADRTGSALEAVDLQALGLDAIEARGDSLVIGATATLDALANDANAPDPLRAIAKAEQPSTMRTLATVGGLVASAHPDSVLLATLLVHEAQVAFAGADDAPLVGVLANGVPAGAIITTVTIDSTGSVARAATGRTPADVPIVAAVCRATTDGVLLALTGVAATPVLVDASDPTVGLTPPADFRGSSEYRRELAGVLADRAVGEFA